jgi:uroporphyrinogen decarboxylase
MNTRERWLAVLERRRPDRVPMEHQATREANERLVEHMGCADLEEVLDILHVDRTVGVSGEYVGPRIPDGEDVFGCRLRDVEYATGVYNEVVHGSLAEFESVEEIEKNYRWPDPDWWDYSGIPQEVAGKEDLPIKGGGCQILMYYARLRGMWQSYVDFVRHPDIVHYCLDKLFDLSYESTRRIFEQIPGKVMMVVIGEDLGNQTGLLMSPAQIREFLMPRMQRMVDLAHDEGAYLFHHNDGAIRDILPDLVESGIDLLNPVQWRCRGMGREELKRDYGERLVFHGGMDNQQTLPFGTVEDVEREVVENMRILGRGGGYILAPCHNVQANTPPENIVAMYEKGYEESLKVH